MEHRLESHTDKVWNLDWHPTQNVLATCGADRSVRIWIQDGDTWKVTDILEESHTRSVRSVAWSPSGTHLASASFDGTAVIWKQNDKKDWEPMLTIEGHESEAKSISWSFDELYVATCGRDKTVWIWETDIDYEYTTMSVLSKHTQDVKMVKFHPTRHLIASCGYDDLIIIWELQGDDWGSKYLLNGHSSTIWAIDWRGDTLISCSDDRSIKIWELVEDRYIAVRSLDEAHHRVIYYVSWHPAEDRVFFLSTSGDNSLKVWNENGENVMEFRHDYEINAGKWNKDGNLIAFGCDDGLVKVVPF